MMEVCDDFGLKRETYHQAVCLLDIFLTREQVAREKLQLAATACLFIATKHEEVQITRA
jgi:hypothetical protein